MTSCAPLIDREFPVWSSVRRQSRVVRHPAHRVLNPLEWLINNSAKAKPKPVELRRSLSLLQLVLYGMGTTIGAGVYALLGEIAATAGYLAPWSFLLSAVLVSVTAVSFATLSSRYPRTAGIAFYVQTGFGSITLARITGLFAIAAGLVSSAALLNGFVGYLQEFVDGSRVLIILVTCFVVGGIACWGISQSIWVAGAITLIEVGGLVWAIFVATGKAWAAPISASVFFPVDVWLSTPAIVAGAVLAFYAYIGFEDMVEVAEEVVAVEKNLPRAIFITLAASTILYILLMTSALLATSPEYLGASSAPLTDLFRAAGSHYPSAITMIGLLAIINGVLIQIIMASRILYGLANRAQLPPFFVYLSPTRQTPTNATVFAVLVVCGMALAGTVAGLAELTSAIILVMFGLVNIALFLIESRPPRQDRNPWLRACAFSGGVICVGLLLFTIVSRLLG